MNRCPITYEPTDAIYSAAGLKRLSPALNHLKDFPYSAKEQIREAAQRAAKMSIQGAQPKLSARLNIKEAIFEVVDTLGRYILKPQNPLFPQLPENEDLTMKMAKAVGIEVPLHGLVYCRDKSLTYFIKRFDRTGRDKKLRLEDFAQLTQSTRETKYDSSMEKVAAVIERYCTFPAIEKVKLFRMTLFNYLTGNEDMHLKNFSLIGRGGRVELSPAYDLLNTSIAIERPVEEIALPLAGKRNKLTRKLLVDYFGSERLGLSEKIIHRVMTELAGAVSMWEMLIDASFLSEKMKGKYSGLVAQRRVVLGF